jgi:hypothetical protein
MSRGHCRNILATMWTRTIVGSGCYNNDFRLHYRNTDPRYNCAFYTDVALAMSLTVLLTSRPVMHFISFTEEFQFTPIQTVHISSLLSVHLILLGLIIKDAGMRVPCSSHGDTKTLFGKTHSSRVLGTTRHGWENYIKIYLKQILYVFMFSFISLRMESSGGIFIVLERRCQ